MSIETRLSKLEAISSPDGPVIFFWAMTKNCRRMTSQEIENGIAALKATAKCSRYLGELVGQLMRRRA